MSDYIDKYLLVMRIFIAGITITASIVIFMFIISGNDGVSNSDVLGLNNQNSVQTQQTYESTNLAKTTRNISKALNTATDSISSGTITLKDSALNASKFAARTMLFVATATGRSIVSLAVLSIRTIGDTLLYIIRIPKNIISSVVNLSALDSIIRPTGGYAEVPIIDPNSPELLAAISALPPKADKKLDSNQGPVWPIKGRVSTSFGVPHWPYQKTHTGIDITDNTIPGTTSVRPFRPGKIIDIAYSNYGLGNHVTLDHGNSITSVYAHLHTINVKVGEEANLKTVLGTEGTTGLSTGTHLHFEIRVNGQAANPSSFINGRPQ